jgi:hypothetical protein
LEIWDDEGKKCTFYTVRWEDAKESETDKFFNKYDAIPELKTATQQILSFVLDSLGDDYGAIDALFNRSENEVTGLPNTGKGHSKTDTVCLSQVSASLVCIRD